MPTYTAALRGNFFLCSDTGYIIHYAILYTVVAKYRTQAFFFSIAFPKSGTFMEISTNRACAALGIN